MSSDQKTLSMQQYEILLAQAEAEIKSTDLEEARELCRKAGVLSSMESDLPSLVRQHRDGTVVSTSTTGGHSNTDHLIVLTGDYRTDRITELRRNLLTRCRAEQPEERGDERWDKPRIAGERRRRIVRQKDLPSAPPEPPPSGYVVFLGQMTTKLRHDRIHERHNQTKAVQEISRMWRMALTDDDREYYNNFADTLQREYKQQDLEFRATGHFEASSDFERTDGAGLWVRKKYSEKNALEKEIAEYDTVVFPMRPPQFDEEYKRKEREGIERRKKRLREQTRLTRKGQRKSTKPKKSDDSPTEPQADSNEQRVAHSGTIDVNAASNGDEGKDRKKT